MRTLGWDSKHCQAAARSLRSLSVRVLDAMIWELVLVLGWVGWLLNGFGVVVGCTLYEDCLEVEVVSGVVRLERRKGAWRGRGSELMYARAFPNDEHVKDPADRRTHSVAGELPRVSFAVYPN